MKIVFRLEAKDDLKAAKRYYTRESRPLGKRFGLSVDQSLALISHFPEMCQVVFEEGGVELRRAPIGSFNETIFYTYSPQPKTLTIYAVMHTSRDAKHWQERPKK